MGHVGTSQPTRAPVITGLLGLDGATLGHAGNDQMVIEGLVVRVYLGEPQPSKYGTSGTSEVPYFSFRDTFGTLYY